MKKAILAIATVGIILLLVSGVFAIPSIEDAKPLARIKEAKQALTEYEKPLREETKPSRINYRPTSSVFFAGKGYAYNEENPARNLIAISLRENQDEIYGRLIFEKKTYNVSGFNSEDGTFFFTVYDNGEAIGSFNGKTRTGKYIEGQLSFANPDWTITDWQVRAFSGFQRTAQEDKPLKAYTN